MTARMLRMLSRSGRLSRPAGARRHATLVALAAAIGAGGASAPAPKLPPQSGKEAMSIFEPFIGHWKGEPEANADFVNYRSLRWNLDKTVVRYSEFPHPDKRWRVVSLIGWNPVEREIQGQEHADWGNLVRVRYQKVDGGLERRMTVYNSSDKKIHHWISSWLLIDKDTFQSQAREYDADRQLVQEWPVRTYHRIEAIPETVVKKPRRQTK